MISEVKPDQPPTRDETGLLDSVWAYFLHDYDNIEDDKFSVVSIDETLSDDGYESLKDEVQDVKTKDETGSNTSEAELKKRDAKLKKKILDASLKRSTELLAHAKKLKAAKNKLVNDRATISDIGMATNGNWMDRTPEFREYSLEDNVDTNSVRVGPPGIIFIEKDDLGDLCIGGEKARNVRNLSTTMLRRGVEVDIEQKSSVYVEKGEQAQKLTTYNDSTPLDEKAVKRRELIRRIAILRIRATKARMARADL
jgi:uncharacterized protein YdcH (DUF465 family)